MTAQNRQALLDLLATDKEQFEDKIGVFTDVSDEDFDKAVLDIFSPDATIDGQIVRTVAGVDPLTMSTTDPATDDDNENDEAEG